MLGWVGVGVVAEAVFGAFRNNYGSVSCGVVDGVSLRGDRDTGPFVLDLEQIGDEDLVVGVQLVEPFPNLIDGRVG